jgi:hypothetical protein
MPADDSYLRHQQQRWLRHDAHLWIRPDAARWVKPGFDPGEIYPTQKRKPDVAKQAASSPELAAEVAHGYRLNALLREQLAEVKADMARRRRAYQEESKYSPSQPRVPAGNPDGGQWMDGSVGTGLAGGRPGLRDTRLSSSEKKPPLGRFAMLEIMAQAAARVVKAYRAGEGLFDLFGHRTGVVAHTRIDDKDIFGSNSSSLTYTSQDERDAQSMRDLLVQKYPNDLATQNLGHTPNNALFHAETNILLRAARESGGTLEGRSLEIYIDDDMCPNCRSIVPLVGKELGNPNLTFIDPKWITTIRDGSVISRSKR